MTTRKNDVLFNGVKIGEFHFNKGKKQMIEPLLDVFCSVNDISVQDIKGRSRKNGLPLFRHVFAYIARKETNTKLKYISESIGLDRSSVVYGIGKVNDCLSIPRYHPNIKRMVDTFSTIYNQSTEELKLTESDHTTSETLEKLTRTVSGRLSRGRVLEQNQHVA